MILLESSYSELLEEFGVPNSTLLSTLNTIFLPLEYSSMKYLWDLIGVGKIIFLNQYISNISNLYNPDVNLSLASQTICDHMFSYPKSDHIFSYFWLCTWFIYFFLSCVVIVHLLQIQEGAGIYCKLNPNWIKSTQARILFLSQYRTGIQNQIRYTTWRNISKYHRLIRQQASLYFYSLIETASWLFITRVFPRS